MRRRFLRVILATFGFALIPFVLIVLLQKIYVSSENNLKNAAERLEDSYTEIDVSDYVASGGSAMVVDENLTVVNLGGPAICGKTAFTMEEWTEFLHKTGEVSKYNYDIAYHEGEAPYWLVMRSPQSITLSIALFFNPEAPNYKPSMTIFLIVQSLYVIALIIFVVVYSKKAASKITSSVEEVYDGAEKLERGEYDIKSSEGETLELDRLGRAMEHLASELREKDEIRTEEEEKRMLLVSEISHDLKNPLASVQGYSEMLLSGRADADRQQDYLKMIYDNSVRSNSILQSLFTYSKLGSAGYKAELEETDICEYTRQIIAEYIPRLEEAGFRYKLDIPEEEILVDISQDLFRRVYDNLIENSMKYNEAGTEIGIIVRRTDKNVQIIVMDNGVGIPEEHREKIFTPFYRGDDKARNSKSGGSGLGLAIVKRIVELHNGSIAFISDHSGGCKYVIEL